MNQSSQKYKVLPTTEEAASVLPSTSDDNYPTATEEFSQTSEYLAVSTACDQDDDIEVHSTSINTEGPSSSAAIQCNEPLCMSALTVAGGYDGVFANMAAKPELLNEKKQNGQINEEETITEAPPEYNEVVHDSAPPYFDTIITTVDGDAEEVLVEGLPVGSPVTFFTTMLVSMSFQFVGFLLTYLLSTTWAGRRGSLSGFGITLLHYGLYLRSHVSRLTSHTGNFPSLQSSAIPFPPGSTPEQKTAILARTEWLSYLLMLVGWFMIVRSCADYLRMRRMRDLILSRPEGLSV